jgi:hypothetical protein
MLFGPNGRVKCPESTYYEHVKTAQRATSAESPAAPCPAAPAASSDAVVLPAELPSFQSPLHLIDGSGGYDDESEAPVSLVQACADELDGLGSTPLGMTR